MFLSHFALDASSLDGLLPLNDLYQRHVSEPEADRYSCLGEIAVLGLAEKTFEKKGQDAIPIAVIAAGFKAALEAGRPRLSDLFPISRSRLLETVMQIANQQLPASESISFPDLRNSIALDQWIDSEQLRIIIQSLDHIIDTLGPILRINSEDRQEDRQP